VAPDGVAGNLFDETWVFGQPGVGGVIYFTPGLGMRCGCIALRGAAAGGGRLTTAAAHSTYFASVGIYAEGSQDPVSLMEPTVDRAVANQITLNFAAGSAMQVRPGGAWFPIIKYSLIAYPNATAANADPQRDGTGSIFYGRVTLYPGGHVSIKSPKVPASVPGFLATDWTLSTPEPGVSRATWAGAAKVLTGAGLNTDAVVVSVADPDADPGVVPGASPIVLVLITIALLGSGIAVLRLRSRTAMA
jgi:hypothetical protein